MVIDSDVLLIRNAILERINDTNERMSVAIAESDSETIASCSYLVAEYEQMLEEFDRHNSISKS